MHQRIPGQSPGVSPISVHFVNNVLAAAASYIEEDPDTARDVLAELGAFLSHRLRGPRTVSPAEELDHIAVYMRLEQARFPGRIEVELPAVSDLPSAAVGAGDVQAPVSDAISAWMGRHTGPVRVALSARDGVLDLRLDRPDAPSEAGERVQIPWNLATAGSAI